MFSSRGLREGNETGALDGRREDFFFLPLAFLSGLSLHNVSAGSATPVVAVSAVTESADIG